MKTLTRYILSSFGGKVVERREIEKVCRRFSANATSTINFMISYGYFLRVLRGLYYVKTLEEFKLKKSVNVHEILSLGMEKLRINWYFGLYTSLRLNGLTHEYFDTIFILNDRIFRPREIKVGGERVKFLKLKSKLFGFGTMNKDHIKFSDIEKTLLDFIYVSRYRTVPEERIISIIEECGKNVKTEKIKAYLKFYPKTVEMVVKNARLI
jgi:predicted transcriptional regulator of viral defense system